MSITSLSNLFGPITTSTSTPSISATFSAYESSFAKFEAQHWASDGSNWATTNYYDRAFINYVWYARTGDQAYLEHANAVAQDYLKNYVEASDYSVASWWSMPKGLTAHYLINGDQASLTAIGRMADQIAGPNYVGNNWAGLFDPQHMEGREQARALETLTQAVIVDAPSTNDFRALAKSLVEKILTSGYQLSDGSRPSYVSGVDENGQPVDKPFMNGLMNEALINYYEQVDADPRIVEFIKKNLDYMWANEWDPVSKGFEYVDKPTSTGETGAPAPGLNMLIVSGFGFVYKHTGDETYRQRGDLVFEGGVEGAWLYDSKQFNQQYASSYNYIAYTRPELAFTLADPLVDADPKTEPDVPSTEVGVMLLGTESADVLNGGNFGDELHGLGGADKLYGGGGDDTLIGGAGGDLLDGGDGVDTASYITAAAGVTADLAKATNNRGDAHRDKYVSIENLAGSDFADTLRGDARDNIFWGQGGADKLDGQAGNDTLYGGDEDDFLCGGEGEDVLFGGTGADVFVFQNISDSLPSNFDTIMDFTPGVDRIDLRAIDANTKARGDQAFVYIGDAEFSGKAGELRFFDGVISADVNGDRRTDFHIKLSGIDSLTLSDFDL